MIRYSEGFSLILLIFIIGAAALLAGGYYLLPNDSKVPLESVTAPVATTSSGGSLSYDRTVSYVDENKRQHTVVLQYKTIPLCDSVTTKERFVIETGDGASYPADCSGVVEHTYKQFGVYRARYLREGSEIATVTIDLHSLSE